jgi:hypothetical protein
MTPSAYNGWLRSRLSDFQVVAERGAELDMASLIGGDAYRLQMTLRADGPVTLIHADLTTAAD